MTLQFRVVLLTAAAALSSGAWAADACSSFKWNVAREVQLFATAPTTVSASTDGAKAPQIRTSTLYALELQPQNEVRYVAPPSKPMLGDGAFGGLVKFKVAAAGQYRVAIDSGFWLDVVHDGKPLQSVDFNGSRDCAGPRKIVVYELPAGAELTLQMAQATDKAARLSVTPVAAGTP